MTTTARLAAGLAIAMVVPFVALAGGPSAVAAGCRTVTVQNAVPVGITLDPPRTSVAYGGCVQFVDSAFGPSVTIKVAGGYRVTLAYGENTSAKASYAASAPGRHDLTADSSGGSAQGRITVGPAPSHSPSPAPSPSPSAASPAPSSTGAGGTGPQVARRPHRHDRRPVAPPTAALPHAAPPPLTPGVGAAPGIAPSVAGSPPGPLQTTTPAAVAVAGPVEPPTDRGVGLPASVAVLVVVGVGTALLRALLAEPVVDSRRSVGGAA